MRSSTADVMETLARPMDLTLEQAMEFCAEDECVEVTPRGRAGAQGRADRQPAGPRQVTREAAG